MQMSHNKHLPYGDMAIIAMKGCEEFAKKVDYYLQQWRGMPDEHTYVITPECPRFGTGEAKGLVNHSAAKETKINQKI